MGLFDVTVKFSIILITRNLDMLRIISVIGLGLITTACSTLTKDSHVPMNLSFSDNSGGKCDLQNKRESYEVEIPGTENIRRSDDALRYDCKTKHGRPA